MVERDVEWTPEDVVVDVVVVSFNTCELTLRCLSALLASSGVDPRIVVVDNGSSDGSVDAIERLAIGSNKIRLVRLGKNLGFGAANNRGMRLGSAEFIAFVNSDAFVERETLKCLVDYQKKHPEVGVVGPRILNGDGTFQESCFRFPTPWRSWLENTGASRFGKIGRAFWRTMGGAENLSLIHI
jgi:GT2 family glycosyltransferase